MSRGDWLQLALQIVQLVLLYVVHKNNPAPPGGSN